MAAIGAQPGNKNARKGRLFEQALIREIKERDLKEGEGATLRKLAAVMLDKAIGGDLANGKEVIDRLDGKVPQGLEHTGAEGGELVIRDARESLGLARRVAYALQAGKDAIEKAQRTAEAAGDKQAEKKEA